MAHEHPHKNANAYYVEQLLTVALCGAFGVIMALMYFNGMVRFLFGQNEVQSQRVLIGGSALLAVVAVRAIYLWFTAGAKQPVHDPSRAECGRGACGNENGHSRQHFREYQEAIRAAPSLALTRLPVTRAPLPMPAGRTPGHDHGWSPWRFVLLGLPVVLFLLGLPNQGIRGGVDVKLSNDEWEQLRQLDPRGKGDDVQRDTIKQLGRAALDRSARQELAGQTVQVTGMYSGDDPFEFTVTRFHLPCCAHDGLPVSIKVAINPQVQHNYMLAPARYRHKWVRVTGRLFFTYSRPNNEWRTYLLLYPNENTPPSQLVEIIPPEPYPYEN